MGAHRHLGEHRRDHPADQSGQHGSGGLGPNRERQHEGNVPLLQGRGRRHGQAQVRSDRQHEFRLGQARGRGFWGRALLSREGGHSRVRQGAGAGGGGGWHHRELGGARPRADRHPGRDRERRRAGPFGGGHPGQAALPSG